MADEPDPERLRALEARISKVKNAARPEKTQTGKAFSQGEVAWRMVIELVVGMLLGLSIGYGLDHVFGTQPILLVIFAMVGFAAGVRTMLGTAKQMAVRQTQQDEAARAAGDRRD
jgi:ATP synthase protein I